MICIILGLARVTVVVCLSYCVSVCGYAFDLTVPKPASLWRKSISRCRTLVYKLGSPAGTRLRARRGLAVRLTQSERRRVRRPLHFGPKGQSAISVCVCALCHRNTINNRASTYINNAAVIFNSQLSVLQRCHYSTTNEGIHSGGHGSVTVESVR